MDKTKVYIQVDSEGRIICCEGGVTAANITCPEAWVLLDEGEGERYERCQSMYLDGGIVTGDGIYRYKLAEDETAPFGVRAVLRAEEELEADRGDITQAPPTETERLRADVDFLAAMTGVTL